MSRTMILAIAEIFFEQLFKDIEVYAAKCKVLRNFLIKFFSALEYWRLV